MTKTFPRIIILFTFCLFLVSWGSLGHRTINRKCTDSFPASMNDFKVWSSTLESHASDADNRKSSDTNESPKHYLDVENYPEFNSTGRIYSTYDSIVNKYGTETVISNGTLPWATEITYNLLVTDFQNLNWPKAVLDASDLGHYVADGHMPLHISANYDGQKTGNKGIHSRYESEMVGDYISQLSTYSGIPANYVNNVNKYIFNYIYTNHRYVDSVLIADNYAKSIDASYGSTYYSSLWSKTKFTTSLFQNASHALAELIYSAWIDAGSPVFGSLTHPSSINENSEKKLTVFPNPTTGIINFTDENFTKAELCTLTGKLVGRFYQNKVNIGDMPAGVYIMNLYDKNGQSEKIKIILTK